MRRQHIYKSKTKDSYRHNRVLNDVGKKQRCFSALGDHAPAALSSVEKELNRRAIDAAGPYKGITAVFASVWFTGEKTLILGISATVSFQEDSINLCRQHNTTDRLPPLVAYQLLVGSGFDARHQKKALNIYIQGCN